MILLAGADYAGWQQIFLRNPTKGFSASLLECVGAQLLSTLVSDVKSGNNDCNP